LEGVYGGIKISATKKPPETRNAAIPLSDVKIRNAKPTEKQTTLFDMDGLYLLVTPQGGKYWRFKYRFDGKEWLLALRMV